MIAPASSLSQATRPLAMNVEAPPTHGALTGHSGAQARVAPSGALQVATSEVYTDASDRSNDDGGSEWTGDVDLRVHALAVFETKPVSDRRRARALDRLRKKFAGQLDVISAREDIGRALHEDAPFDRANPARRAIAHGVAGACVSLLGITLALITAAGGSNELPSWLPGESVRWLPETASDTPVLRSASWGRIAALLEDLASRDHVEADLARRLMAVRHIVLAAGVLALGAEGASLEGRPRTARLCELRVTRFVAQRVPGSIDEATRDA